LGKEGKSTTTKVFDTFLLLGRGTLSDEAEIKVEWPEVSLSETETQLLKQLCAQISYLGRAESWAELSLIDVDPADCNAIPYNRQISLLSNKEQVKVLAPLTSEGMEGFRAALTTLPKPKKGKVKWQAPADALEALELDVRDLHAQGWNGIPGTRWVTYSIPAQNPQHLSASPQNVSFTGPMYARFALASNVLPRLTEAAP
jgi:CRISPR-associated protein Csb2